MNQSPAVRLSSQPLVEPLPLHLEVGQLDRSDPLTWTSWIPAPLQVLKAQAEAQLLNPVKGATPPQAQAPNDEILDWRRWPGYAAKANNCREELDDRLAEGDITIFGESAVM
nr:uncharacterized protein CI109_006752 [Kwoniella shandongensis]KAA5524881.1 hypothetical protein CI109_006752 [Kwoniella shandongensis]